MKQRDFPVGGGYILRRLPTYPEWQEAVQKGETKIGYDEYVRRAAYPAAQGEEEEASEIRR